MPFTIFFYINKVVQILVFYIVLCTVLTFFYTIHFYAPIHRQSCPQTREQPELSVGRRANLPNALFELNAIPRVCPNNYQLPGCVAAIKLLATKRSLALYNSDWNITRTFGNEMNNIYLTWSILVRCRPKNACWYIEATMKIWFKCLSATERRLMLVQESSSVCP